jgi:serine/threonine protein kinase
MPILDLKPYGVNFVLEPGVNTINHIHRALINTGVSMLRYGDDRDYMRVKGKNYTHLKYLGEGSYGTTYSGTGPDGKQYAIKRIHDVYTNDDIITLMKECIQQIIIVEHTKDMANGPFAPILHGIGYNGHGREAFIVSELMTNTVWNLVSSQTKEQNDEFIPGMLSHVAFNLNELQIDLEFNHRDLKTDNLMYLTNPDDGTITLKFIDFGFTCLTWEGMFISGGSYFKYSPKCFRVERDIVQLVTSIVWFHKDVLSHKLQKRLMDIIATKHGRSTRKLTQYMTEWTNSYKLLDRNNFVVKAGTPKMVYDEMTRFIEGKPFQGKRVSRKVRKPAVVDAPVDLTICPPEKIINPATRRCVLRTGAIGRKLEKEMAVPAEPVAVDAVPPAVPNAGSDGCPPGKIRNPKTRRCVKRTGAIGKKLEVL